MKSILYITLFLFAFTVNAQETIKTMFYNLLEFPFANPANRSLILRDILDEYDPDIFMICELQGEAGAEEILTVSLNYQSNTYSRAEYITNQSSGSDLQQMVYFKTDKFSLETSEVTITNVRDINRYQLKLNTVDQDSDPIFLDLYVTHLKSSQGSDNQNLRLDMVTELTTHLESVDPNSFVIFAGDFNLYSSTEPAYIELLDETNAIVMVDPIHTLGAWHNNEDFQGIHTQSTRISSGPFGAGAGGGLDDRFDFITISENMESDPKMRYLDNTYKSFGNNGNCYNVSINNEDCTGVYSQETRENLYNMSDHLPVIMELETNKEFLLSSPEFVANNAISIKNTLVTNQLLLSISEEYSEKVTFAIYNSLGQKVLEYDAENENSIIFDVSFLQSGLFYIKTSITNGAVLKFMKR